MSLPGPDGEPPTQAQRTLPPAHPPGGGYARARPCSPRRGSDTLDHIAALSEIARFRADDDGCYVAADLACPWCLSWAIEWRLRRLGWDAAAACRCKRCGRERDVYLNPEQALRLALHDRCPLDLSPQPDRLNLAN